MSDLLTGKEIDALLWCAEQDFPSLQPLAQALSLSRSDAYNVLENAIRKLRMRKEQGQ